MIDWGAFLVVAVATILGAGGIVLFFALGVRLGTLRAGVVAARSWPRPGRATRCPAQLCSSACTSSSRTSTTRPRRLRERPTRRQLPGIGGPHGGTL